MQVIPENSVAPPSVKYRSNVSSEQRRDRQHHHGKAHQRLHRHSHYPMDDREGHYQSVTRQVCASNLTFYFSLFYEFCVLQRAEHGMNPYGGEFGRPGSRSGITESVPFTHYVNYNELQTRIR